MTSSDADSRRWRRARDLFDRSVDLGPEARDRLLERECADDPELLAEVRGLLAASEDDPEFLRSSAATELGLHEPGPGDSDHDLVGRSIGPYQLTRLVGQGGMGVVYEAERIDHQFEQRVAIKLVRRGVASDLIVRRFQRERQILAKLSHPNIAHLLDGGVTESGQPYFVMEYVNGVPIDQHCHEVDLGIRERLELFLAVGDAVQFAHSHLVVHRDLKPGNVLVTGDGEVKLLDFGIAKLLPEARETALDVTETIGRVLTPAYASPEQVTGSSITTASDVYSLGVILYELLTGRMPLPLDTHSLEEVVRLVCSVDPMSPSAAVSDQTIPADTQPLPKGARKQLTGELDSIVLMALRKEPERRYASAGQLSDDIRRLLAGLPVHAERDRASYRLKKFVRRNRGLSIAAGLLLISLIGGLLTTTIQGARADRARQVAEFRFVELRELANSLLFEIHDQIENLPGSTEAQRLVIERGLQYLDRLAEQSGGDPELQREVAEAYIRLGGVQGQMAGANIGDRRGALVSYGRAHELIEAVVQTDLEDLVARRSLALVHEKMGDVRAVIGEKEEGVAHAREALVLFQSIAEAKPEVARHRLSVAISHVKLGDLSGHPVFPNIGDPEAAVSEYERARAVLETLPDSGTTLPGKRRYVGLVNERLGYMHRVAERWDLAREAFDRSLLIRREIENPAHRETVRDVAITLQNLCEVEQGIGQSDLAVPLCEQALDTYRTLERTDPANVGYAADVATGAESLAIAYLGDRRAEAAFDAFGLSLSRRGSLLVEDPENLSNRLRYGRLTLRLCIALAEHPDRPVAPTLSELGVMNAGDACERGRSTLLAAAEGALSESDADLVDRAWVVRGLNPPQR